MKEIIVDDSLFRVYTCGKVERKMKSGTWKEVPNTRNHSQGYNVILIHKKQYMRSRLMFLAFLSDTKVPENKKLLMHHLDGDGLNCSLDNLSVETHLTINVYR